MNFKVLLAPLTGLVTCFLITYFMTSSTPTEAITTAVITAVTVLIVNMIIARVEKAKANVSNRINIAAETNDVNRVTTINQQ